MSATETVARLIEGWEQRDLSILRECLAEDTVWHNMPYPPVTGREAVLAAIGRFLDTVAEARFIVHHGGEVAPGIVVNERNDLFTTTDGRRIDIPVMGIFEVRDGRIHAWRDYFDPATMNG